MTDVRYIVRTAFSVKNTVVIDEVKTFKFEERLSAPPFKEGSRMKHSMSIEMDFIPLANWKTEVENTTLGSL